MPSGIALEMEVLDALVKPASQGPGEQVRRWLAECRARGYVPKAREILIQIATDETLPVGMIKSAASELIQYEDPKLLATANVTGTVKDFAHELEARRMRRPKLIEGNGRQVEERQVCSEPTEARESETVSAEHLTKGFQSLRRRPL